MLWRCRKIMRIAKGWKNGNLIEQYLLFGYNSSAGATTACHPRSFWSGSILNTIRNRQDLSH
jgi:hypothetical protein